MKKDGLIKYVDKQLLFLMILYSGIGLLTILSASNVAAVLRYGVSPYYFFFKQLVFISISFGIGFIFVLKIDIAKYKNLVFFSLITLIVMLFGLLLYGQMVNSAKSWIDLGFFSIQPSEFIKLVLVLYMGIFFGEYTKGEGKQHKILILLAVCAAPILLVAVQPDLGTAAIIASIIFLTFLAIPLKKNNLISILKLFAGGLVIIVAVFLINSTAFLNEMQMNRFQYQNPCSRYTEDSGYQVCNGFIALHNGGLFGLGIGKSTQKYLYLPEAHTDFIFPILVEEMGVIVGALVLLGYIYMLFRIIKIAKNKILDEKVKLSSIAQRTPGYSGADLENLLNEAALLAVRRNKSNITMDEVDEASDRVLMGPAKTSRKVTDFEKKVVSFHEAGHAVAGIILPKGDEVHKITIIPRGMAGGYTQMLPKEEKTLVYTKEELLQQITVLLSGRVSEELFLNEISTGATDDIKRATKIARAMVTEYGMSGLGPVQYEHKSEDVFLGRDYAKSRNFSDQVALEIDSEIKKIINECYESAKRCNCWKINYFKSLKSYRI